MSYLFKEPIAGSTSDNVSNAQQKNTLSYQQKLQKIQNEITDNLYQRIIKIINILGSDSIDFLLEMISNPALIKNRVMICDIIERLMAGLQRYPHNKLRGPDITELVKPLVIKFATHAWDFVRDLLYILTNSFNQINPDIIIVINGLLEDKNIADHDLLLKKNINQVFSYLATIPRSDVAQLSLLFKHKPYPSFESFYKAITEHQTISLICIRSDINPFGNRNLLNQFDEQQQQNLVMRLRAIQDVVRDEVITRSQRVFLFGQYQCINILSAQLMHLPREKLKQGLHETVALFKLLSAQVDSVKLQNSIQNWQHINVDSTEGKILIARATLLTYLREVYYRTSPAHDQIYPNAMQIIYTLHTIQSGGHVVLGTDNNPDKTITALQNAMLWCEGHTVDNCFNNIDDAERDKYRHADFFKYIGADVTCIGNNSELEQLSEIEYNDLYKEHAINYSSNTNLALYRDRCALSGTDFRKVFKTPISINIDKLIIPLSGNPSQTSLSEYSVTNLDYYKEIPGARILGNITSKLNIVEIQELYEKYQIRIYQSVHQQLQLQINSNLNDQVSAAAHHNQLRVKRAEHIILVVQKHVEKCLQALVISNKLNTEKAKKEFLIIRQEIMGQLYQKWDEIYINFSSSQAMKPREKLNQVTEKFITEVNQLWIRNGHQLEELGVPQELTTIKVEDHLLKNNHPQKDYAKIPTMDDRYLNYYKAQIENPKGKVRDIVKFFGDINNSKVAAKHGRENVFAYQETHSAEMLTKAKIYIKDSLNEYLASPWWKLNSKFVSQDRRDCVDPLINPDLDNIDKQSEFHSLLKKLNEAQFNSFKKDCEINNLIFSFKRDKSKLRDAMIFNSKRYLFSVCPPSQLVQIAKQELCDLRTYLKHCLTANPAYTRDSEIKRLLNSLMNILPTSADADFNPTEKLAVVLTKFKQIINHPEYLDLEDKVSSLFKIALNVNYLYERTKNVAELKDGQYQQVYKTVYKLLHNLDIQEPSIFCIFSNSFYQIPANQNMFPELLNQVVNPKEKYYLHEAMKQVKDKLTDKYGAYNVEFAYENAKLTVKFKLMDDKTLATTSNEIAIHVDIKNKTFICEPVVGGAALAQSAMHAPVLGPRL